MSIGGPTFNFLNVSGIAGCPNDKYGAMFEA